MKPILSPPPTNPKFTIGDRVSHTYIYEDELDPERHGKEFTDFGIVQGIVWGHPYEIDRCEKRHKHWFYLVFVDRSTLPDFNPIENYLSTYKEDDLELL
ncbi:MAG TPA: hypothetical protein VK211_12665 [Kamptonema sp.]|nr:hypothetical protein [Kamptonema sp.]